MARKTSKTFQTRVSGANAMLRSDARVQPWPTYQPTPALPTDTKNHHFEHENSDSTIPLCVWKPFYGRHNYWSTCYLPCAMDVGPTPTPKHKPSARPVRPRFLFWVWGWATCRRLCVLIRVLISRHVRPLHGHRKSPFRTRKSQCYTGRMCVSDHFAWS